MSYTEVKTWKVSDLLDALSASPEKGEKIIIPQYQRNLVWNKNQKSLLIESIKEGLPIGALLLYKESITDNLTSYHLVDGLQRSTSIRSYCSEPTKYFNEDHINSELISKLSEVFSADTTTLTKIIIKWIQGLKEFTETANFSSFDLINAIAEELDKDLKNSQIKLLKDSISPFLEKIKSESNINEISIPVLIYSGDKSNLPKIFERVNSRGTNLNKYQIYAATWATYDSFNINNINIIDKIKEKYDSFIAEGLEVDNYDASSFNTSRFNYFEYFFGFGKLLTDIYPDLFGKGSAKTDQTESIAFNLAAICLDIDTKEMGTLPEELIDKDLNKFEDAILDSINRAYSILKPYLQFKGNRRSTSSPIICHSEYQIVSIIGKIFKTIYDENFDKKEESEYKTKLASLKLNIPFHYLLDILKGYWSGTGDSKALENSRSKKYENTITRDQWESTLNDWYSNDRSKKEKSRVTIKSDAKLFLNYIYSHKFSAFENLSEKVYDIEHLCPVDILKKVANDSNVDGLPISCISNLCLLDAELNQGKKNTTYYEYYDKKIQNGELTTIQAQDSINKIEDFSFIVKSDLEFLESLSYQNIESYYEFLDKRFNSIKNEFYKIYNLNS